MIDLHRKTATEVVQLLRRRQVSPLELVEAAAARIAETDGALNAVPTLCLDRARAHARRIEADIESRADDPRWLGGLPIVVKDLNDVEGVRTTYGSPLFAEHVPDGSDAMVERLERNGAIVIGKANTPEFGHGANTFNAVFGETRNPWNTKLTCGGSSGGSAVAVASGQAWAATGSDLGCSLRTPAAFCGIVGLRPSPGRVARSRTRLPYDNLWVQGPMARTVGDTALMLDAMVGKHLHDPISFETSDGFFSDAARSPKLPIRVAYSPDLGGITPVDDELEAVCAKAVDRLADHGVNVESASPDLSDARDIFRVLRANQFVGDLGEIVWANRDTVRPEVVENLERGMALSANDIAVAERARGKLFARVADFMRSYDLLITPATIVPPFDVSIRAIDKVGSYRFETYYDWYTIAYAITLTSLPALALPCGFMTDGRPVGLQMVGRPRGEYTLLRAAAAAEQVFEINNYLPINPV